MERGERIDESTSNSNVSPERSSLTATEARFVCAFHSSHLDAVVAPAVQLADPGLRCCLTRHVLFSSHLFAFRGLGDMTRQSRGM